MSDQQDNRTEQVVDSSTLQLPNTAPEDLETTEMTTESLVWGVADVMIDTGAGEALLTLAGAPAVLVLAFGVFKKWHKNNRKK